MAVTKEKYNQEKIERLADYLRTYYEKERPIDYEILVDGFKAVRRTNDPGMFNMYESFVNAGTESITILLYSGNSNNNDKHIFYFGEPVKVREEVAGTDQTADELAKIKFDRMSKNGKIAQLEAEKVLLAEELDELRDEIKALENEKEEIKKSKNSLSGIAGEVGSALLESFVRRNRQGFGTIPGGEALAGVVLDEKKDPAKENAEGSNKESEVSFKPKENPKEQAMGQPEQEAIYFVNKLRENFTQDQFDKIQVILEEMARNKAKIEAVLKDVTVK